MERVCCHCGHTGSDVRVNAEGNRYCKMCREVRKERDGRRTVSGAWRAKKVRSRRKPR